MGCDVIKERELQVSIQRDRSNKGLRGGAQRPSTSGRRILSPAASSECIRNRRDQAICPLNCHITVGRQILGAVEIIGDQAKMTAGRDQFVTFGIATNGTQNGGFHPDRASWRCSGNATGQARDATGHVRAALHLHSASPDYVPQDRADAKDIRFGKISAFSHGSHAARRPPQAHSQAGTIAFISEPFDGMHKK